MEVQIVVVGPGNAERLGIGCVVNKHHPGYLAKQAWLKARFDEGLRYLLALDDRDKPLGFLEYVPGEFAWRPVSAKGWYFIHCLWVYSGGQKIGGIGRRLVEECIRLAQEGQATGVATLASDGPWMANPSFFAHLGFEEVEVQGRFNLMAKRLRPGPSPKILVAKPANLDKGLQLVYADQCPMLAKSVLDMQAEAKALGISLRVRRLNSAIDAQQAPSLYGVFGLYYDGDLVADHYVSAARFRNIVGKELKLVSPQ